jgi:predicted TIM-barrel fold metal-dependent hydrolase
VDAEHETWLGRRVEEALEPELAICDPHHHLWDHPTDRYLLEELRADTGSGHRVVSTVFVECTSAYREDGPEALRPVGETDFVAAIAAESERTAGDGAVIAGIVGLADLRLGDAVEEVLAAHVAAGGGRFRGIRHASSYDPDPGIRNAHTDPPPGLLGDSAFRAGIAALGRAGLRFDAWLYHPQIGELTDLARAHPEVPIVLDHLGGPLGVGPYAGRREEVREVWRAAIAELAGCANVSVKLGGIGMPIFGLAWHQRPDPPSSEELAEAWGPDITWCIERFGADRCMFESNFPVDKRSCSYGVLWNAFKRIAAGASPDEKAALFSGTATRFYGLPDVG